MQFYPIAPSPLLAGFVRYYWVLEGDVPSGEFYTHRTMACGCPELCFHYKGGFCEVTENKILPSFQTGIHGQSLHYRRFRTGESFGLFGAFLYPFAVPVLLGIPASEINNQMVDLASLLGREGEILAEKMLTAKDNRQRAGILSAFLENRLPHAGSSRVIPAIRQVIHTGGQTPIQSLSDQYFLSSRQFTRVFSEYAGFPPKLFSRLLRFEQALSEYGNKDKSLTDIAYDCGYYDQSHFIHEFKEFSGHHPHHYFFGQAEGTEWKED
ncbi:MAG: AraC family transcriptional regulator [Chitinophagaceae bacterium]|nr:AraC family transcriptional regulator [Chitinophagaceae bacterium]